ncbi:peptidoglycan-binding protein [Streptomyces pratensis]|uniref:peptidoglycan-binding protein n=1 Tax=Streptomyces pratensis TaxID=1169025 RepID=UPI0030170F7C
MRDQRAEAWITDFARALRALKERTPHSYETLAVRVGVSRSALHRYCSGQAVPAEFGTVQLLARQCGADRGELTELHRSWVLASESIGHVPARAPIAEPEGGAPAAATCAGRERAQPDDGRRSHRGAWLTVAAAVLGAVALVTVLTGKRTGGEEVAVAADGRPLFSGECREPVHTGQQDACVREVQELLAGTGAGVEVDGIFGLETRRRVEAFQVRAGLSVDGIVGDATKRALYDGSLSLTTWTPERVADRVREVFTQAPDTAVRIARCQSFLDPLYILPNTDATRNWGVFQISDARLRDLRGSPADALDPEWNIRAAHRLWSQNKDFHHWPACLAAIEDEGGADGGEGSGP